MIGISVHRTVASLLNCAAALVVLYGLVGESYVVIAIGACMGIVSSVLHELVMTRLCNILMTMFERGALEPKEDWIRTVIGIEAGHDVRRILK